MDQGSNLAGPGPFSVHSGMRMNECMYEYPDIMQGGRGEGGAFFPVPLY